MKTDIELFPIYLDDTEAYNLIQKHLAKELAEAKANSWLSGHTQYEYSAIAYETGEVKVNVHYSDDNGFCMNSGTLLAQHIRPFTDEQLKDLIDRKKIRLAIDEYHRRQLIEMTNAILKIRSELFEN